MPVLQELWVYLGRLFRHWLSFLTGGAVIAFLSWGSLYGRQWSPQLITVALFGGVAVAGFRAWRDEYKKLAQKESTKADKIRILIRVSAMMKSVSSEPVKTEADFTAWKKKVDECIEFLGQDVCAALEPHEWNRLRMVDYEVRHYAQEYNDEHRDTWNALVARAKLVDSLIHDLTH